MMIAKEDDDPMFYVGGVRAGGMLIGAISVDDGEEHEFEREEISQFITEEIENLRNGQFMNERERRSRLQDAQMHKKVSEAELEETPKFNVIKRSKMKKQVARNKIALERAELLVDMENIEDKHIYLLEQINQLLTAQEKGGNKYKRKDIKKYINYAIYRIEQQEKGNLNEEELSQHSFFKKIKVTADKINGGHYGESGKRAIQDWTLEDK